MITAAVLVSMVLLPSAFASVAADPGLQSITFSERFAGSICLGSCLSYDLTLTPDGLVEVYERFGRKEHFRFRVKKSAARAAIAQVAPLRSAEKRKSSGPCATPRGPDSDLFNPNVIPFAIEWHGRSRSQRVRACPEEKSTIAAFEDAMTALGVDSTGHPFVRQTTDGSRYGQRVSCDLGNGRWSPPRFDCDGCPTEAIKSPARFYAVDLTHCTVELPVKQ